MSLSLLLDENSESKSFLKRLIQAQHDVVCLKDFLSKGTNDKQVLEFAKNKQRILYTQDRDFLEIAMTVQDHCGVILEFFTKSGRRMNVSQVIDALSTIESHYSNFLNQVIIINSFKNAGTF